MLEIINKIFLSNFFNTLPFFFQRKIRKIFYSSYFCITNLNKLPRTNYQSKFTIRYQKYILDNFSTKKYISKNSFNSLKKLLNKLKLNKVHFFDFGAGDINTYLEIKNRKKFKYFYYDLLNKRKIINKIISLNKLKNIKVINNPMERGLNFNFAFFGSSIGYHDNYNKILQKIISVKCKYVLFSGLILFENNNIKKNTIILKQLNALPNINYVLMFNKQNFISLFARNGYKLVFTKKNHFKKIHFKNLFFFSKKINYVDIFFKKV